MRAYLNGLEELDGEVLAVVANEVVCGTFCAPSREEGKLDQLRVQEWQRRKIPIGTKQSTHML